ncbi:hypothetical protein KEM55_007589, partial [Ascosphaera atra]
AKERDEHCVLTKDGTVEAAHLYPFHLTYKGDDDDGLIGGDRYEFLDRAFRLFGTSRATTWYEAIFPANVYRDTCENLISLSPSAHVYHTRGYFGLRPLRLSDDHKTLDLQFFWLELALAPERERERAGSWEEVPRLWQDHHLSSVAAHGPHWSVLCEHRGTDRLTSGSIISLTTRDPSRCPLPKVEMLEMQWRMQLLVAAAQSEEVDGRDEYLHESHRLYYDPGDEEVSSDEEERGRGRKRVREW